MTREPSDGLSADGSSQSGDSQGGIALIFAAGSGRRLSLGPKALLPWGDSVLVVRAARAARAAGLHPVVTAGPGRCEIVSHLAEAGLGESQVTVVEVPQASAGLSASFRAGVAAIAALTCDDSVAAASVRSDSRCSRLSGRTAITMMLVDQPWVGADVIARLNARYDSDRVVRAVWSGEPGHPVVMSLVHAQVAADGAQGDEAGRSWMRSRRHLIDPVECSDIGNGTDIDTPADLAAAHTSPITT
ncbi:NTP transferase domain-containing protein [Brevibacterium sediminis]|uniref:nucleotidyltransferase family protein n=1 Tax=Brevibacterium sediminis TaxID=1857024 RepID=UPI002174EBB2|nr:NTP transferase domain-containing protein [Brevibacterium sediminis]MCS4593875.1 NTP transferase domain-containing protein [Brevibacterium sediminis]